MDRELPQSAHDAYWQHFEDGTFTLYADGEERAVVDPARQDVTVHHADGFTAELMVPNYVCVFDEAERRLGLPRIDDVRGVEGSPDADARRGSELEADLARETRTPDQWTRAYAARAYHLLILNGVDRELSDAENQAGVHLAEAVAAMDGHDPDADVRAHIEEASAQLANGREDQRYGSPSLACDKALAVMEYEDARLTMEQAAAEEALRRDSAFDWLFQPSRAGQESEMMADRDASDSGHER